MYYVLITIACAVIACQAAYTRRLEHTHFGVLSPAALRARLQLLSALRRRCAVVAIDIRKMHDGNEVLGWSTMNAAVAQLVSVRLRPGRRRDLIGQYGGDEFVIVCPDRRAAEAIAARLLSRCREITAQLTDNQRAAWAARTGGLVDGLHLALIIVPETRDAVSAARDAIDAAGRVKRGVVTGDRSTSGAQGTIVEILAYKEQTQ